MTDVAAVSAAVLYAVAILMLLGLRSWQQYRATGAAGFNGFRSKAMAARVAGLGFVVALVAGVLSPVLVWGHVLPTLGSDLQWAPALAGGGAVLALAGILMAFAAQATMGTSWRIGVDTSESTDLVTHGLFAVIRNPIFTALLTIQSGTTLMAPTWVGALGVVTLLLASQVQVRLVEEPYLLAMHRLDYLGYANRTGRFVPLLGRLQPAEHGTSRSLP